MTNSLNITDVSFGPTPLDEACQALRLAKAAEDEAREIRIRAEQSVIDLMGLAAEGTKTEKTSFFKVSTVSGFTRTLAKDWQTVIGAEGHEVMDQVVRMKPEISVTGLKQLATSNPQAYQRIAKAIVTKPSKPAVRVELLEAFV